MIVFLQSHLDNVLSGLQAIVQVCYYILPLFLHTHLCRSNDYGHHYVNETSKLPTDAVVESYYISPYSQYVSEKN